MDHIENRRRFVLNKTKTVKLIFCDENDEVIHTAFADDESAISRFYDAEYYDADDDE